MDKESYVRAKITDLRLTGGLSEASLSLELGHNKSYIQGIRSGKSLLPIGELAYLCENIFHIAIADFFPSSTYSPLVQKALTMLDCLEKDKVISILDYAASLSRKKRVNPRRKTP